MLLNLLNEMNSNFVAQFEIFLGHAELLLMHFNVFELLNRSANVPIEFFLIEFIQSTESVEYYFQSFLNEN